MKKMFLIGVLCVLMAILWGQARQGFSQSSQYLPSSTIKDVFSSKLEALQSLKRPLYDRSYLEAKASFQEKVPDGYERVILESIYDGGTICLRIVDDEQNHFDLCLDRRLRNKTSYEHFFLGCEYVDEPDCQELQPGSEEEKILLKILENDFHADSMQPNLLTMIQVLKTRN